MIFVGSREDVVAKIDQETRRQIDDMNRAVLIRKEKAIQEVLQLVYDVRPEMQNSQNKLN